MGYRTRGEIKLDILQYIYDGTAGSTKYQISKRELRTNLGLGKNITAILRELTQSNFLIHEPVPQKGKEAEDIANFYRLSKDGLKIVIESQDLIRRLLFKLT